MKQKGFVTIFGLCLMLIVALIVKGIQESEANHAREVLNFEMEQALQNAAESGIVEASELVKNKSFTAGKIFTDTKDFRQGEQTIPINRARKYLCWEQSKSWNLFYEPRLNEK